MARRTFTDPPEVRLAQARAFLGNEPSADADQKVADARAFLRPSGKASSTRRVVVELSADDHDRFAVVARRAGLSVSEALRQVLIQRMPRS